MECDLVSVSIFLIVFIRWHASLAKEVRDTFSLVCSIDSAVAGKYCWRRHYHFWSSYKSIYSTFTQLFGCFLSSCGCGTFNCPFEGGIPYGFSGGHTIDSTTLSADKPQSNVKQHTHTTNDETNFAQFSVTTYSTVFRLMRSVRISFHSSDCSTNSLNFQEFFLRFFSFLVPSELFRKSYHQLVPLWCVRNSHAKRLLHARPIYTMCRSWIKSTDMTGKIGKCAGLLNCVFWGTHTAKLPTFLTSVARENLILCIMYYVLFVAVGLVYNVSDVPPGCKAKAPNRPHSCFAFLF